jgi:hypothetical protein
MEDKLKKLNKIVCQNRDLESDPEFAQYVDKCKREVMAMLDPNHQYSDDWFRWYCHLGKLITSEAWQQLAQTRQHNK